MSGDEHSDYKPLKGSTRPATELKGRVATVILRFLDERGEVMPALELADLILLVLREPTKAMIAAAEKLGDAYHYAGPSESWTAMIDAARTSDEVPPSPHVEHSPEHAAEFASAVEEMYGKGR